MIVTTDEDHPILPQQISRQIKPRVHHIQPLGVEAAVGLCVGAELFCLCIHLTGIFEVSLEALGVVVRIDEVVAGAVGVGRVDVDHLNLAEIRLLQELQHLQVVAFNNEIFSRIKVDALLAAG